MYCRYRHISSHNFPFDNSRVQVVFVQLHLIKFNRPSPFCKMISPLIVASGLLRRSTDGPMSSARLVLSFQIIPDILIFITDACTKYELL